MASFEMFNLTRRARDGVGGVWAELRPHRRAYVLTAVASFGGMLFGWDTGLIGGVLTMHAFQHSFGLDPDSDEFADLQGNIVSILQGGCFFGAAASFYASDMLGRKWSLIWADAIFLAGSVMQTCAGMGTTSLSLLYAGRFVGGFGVGLISAIVPTYIGENADREIRGRCIGTMQLFNVTGIMLSYFVNYGMSQRLAGSLTEAMWRVPFGLQMLPGLLLLVGMLFQNESPRWLVTKGRQDEARAALCHVRGRPAGDATLERELDEMVADVQGHEGLSLRAQLRAACSSGRMLYRSSLAVVLMFWQQCTGTNAINYYSPQIFRSVGLSGTSAGLFATGIYGVVKVVFTALGLLLGVEQAGRKWSLIVGALGQAFAMFYMGINQAVHPHDQSLSGSNVFAIVCVYLFVVFYSFGWGPIPYVLSAECAPNHVRSAVMAASLMMQWLMNFVIAKLAPIMLARITYGTFLLFGSACLLMLLYAVFCVPETKGVPLESIHLLFERNIIRGATRDTLPGRSRARWLRKRRADEDEADAGAGAGAGAGGRKGDEEGAGDSSGGAHY